MDINQIMENIALVESKMTEQINLNLVNTLMMLYQKCIEFFSAVDNA